MDQYDRLLADVRHDEWQRQQPAWAAIGRQISDMRAELGRVLDALNAQDAAEEQVKGVG